MNLVAYVDESGTHDPEGKRKGAGTVSIGGAVALKEDWVEFDVQWRKILKKYKVCYFHFREQFAAWKVIGLGEKPPSNFEKNPYKHLGKDDLKNLPLELVPLAASKLIFGGYVHTKQYIEEKVAGEPNRERHPYELCLDHLFQSYPNTVKRYRPAPWQWKPVAFLFDHSDDPKWRNAIINKFFFYEKTNTNFIEVGFRKKEQHTPLQAADMIAYRVRFNMDRASNWKFGTNWPELDGILFKEMTEWHKKLSQDEKEIALRKLFIVPESVTYEQAMDAIIEESKFRQHNR